MASRSCQKLTLITKDEPQLALYQVPRDEQGDNASSLDDHEPKAAPLESYASSMKMKVKI